METPASSAHYGPWAVDVEVAKQPQELAIQADQVAVQVGMPANRAVLEFLVKEMLEAHVQVLVMVEAVVLAELVQVD